MAAPSRLVSPVPSLQDIRRLAAARFPAPAGAGSAPGASGGAVGVGRLVARRAGRPCSRCPPRCAGGDRSTSRTSAAGIIRTQSSGHRARQVGVAGHAVGRGRARRRPPARRDRRAGRAAPTLVAVTVTLSPLGVETEAGAGLPGSRVAMQEARLQDDAAAGRHHRGRRGRRRRPASPSSRPGRGGQAWPARAAHETRCPRSRSGMTRAVGPATGSCHRRAAWPRRRRHDEVAPLAAWVDDMAPDEPIRTS